MKIALKEAEETKYWLEIIEFTKIMELPTGIFLKIEELIKLLVKIIKNSED